MFQQNWFEMNGNVGVQLENGAERLTGKCKLGCF